MTVTTEAGRVGGTPRTAAPTDGLHDRARAFADDRVAPLVAEMDERAEFCPRLVESLFAEGLMGIEVPEAYGGLGGTPRDVLVVIEEIARVDPAVAVLVDVQNALLVSALLRCGTGEQKRRFLPALASGTVGAYALSETGAGSDAFAMSTTAVHDGDSLVLTGEKAWITNAAEAGLFLVFARGDTSQAAGSQAAGLTACLVPADAPGLGVGERVDKLGIRASSTCPVTLDGVRVPAHDVLGAPGAGADVLVRTLSMGKLGIAAQLVGLAQGVLDLALDRVRERRQFGHRIADFQGVRFPVAELSAQIEAARALLHRGVEEIETGADLRVRMRVAAAAKLVASTVAERAGSLGVDLFGGSGYLAASPAAKFYRDAKIGTIYEGTSNMQKRTIASLLLGGNDGVTDGAAAGLGVRNELEEES